MSSHSCFYCDTTASGPMLPLERDLERPLSDPQLFAHLHCHAAHLAREREESRSLFRAARGRPVFDLPKLKAAIEQRNLAEASLWPEGNFRVERYIQDGTPRLVWRCANCSFIVPFNNVAPPRPRPKACVVFVRQMETHDCKDPMSSLRAADDQ
jgi:hypothetical protein